MNSPFGKTTFILQFLIFAFNMSSCQTDAKNGVNCQSNAFKPQLVINNTIRLMDPNSMKSLSIENIIEFDTLLEDSVNPKRLLSISQDTSQYCILFHSYAANAYSYDQFEIGYLESLPFKHEAHISEYKEFKTENISLGISKKALIHIMKWNHIESTENNYTVLYYEISGSKLNAIYNMPLYYMKFYFTNDVLVRYRAGFAC